MNSVDPCILIQGDRGCICGCGRWINLVLLILQVQQLMFRNVHGASWNIVVHVQDFSTVLMMFLLHLLCNIHSE